MLIAAVLLLIWAYTRKGGISTVVWTDTLQTACMLLAAGTAVVLIGQQLDLSWMDLPKAVAASGHAQWWFTEDWGAPNHAVKQLVAGAFIALCMTGLDQDMMQKNLSCRNLREAQWNMGSFSIVLVFVNLLFLGLGALLLHTESTGMTVERADLLFASVALDADMGWALPVLFLLGLVAAALSSADSALTALTTSVCVDFLGMPTEDNGEAGKSRRQRVHLAVSAGVGIAHPRFSRRQRHLRHRCTLQSGQLHLRPPSGPVCAGAVQPGPGEPAGDRWVPWVAILAPCAGWALEQWTASAGFSFGFALLPINGFLTWAGARLAIAWGQNRRKTA